MITIGKKRQLPPTLTLNLSLVDGFESDDPELQERQQAFIKTVHWVMIERMQLEQLFKDGRIASIPMERDKLVEELHAIENAQYEHEVAKTQVINSLNVASEKQARATGTFRSLKNNPPNRSRLSDKQWEQYQLELKEAQRDCAIADGKKIEAVNKHGLWMERHNELANQSKQLERKIEVLDFDRDVLTGKIDPNDHNRRVHDSSTGLQIRGGTPGVIRTTNT